MSKRINSTKILTAAETIAEREGTSAYCVLLNAHVFGYDHRWTVLMATAGNLFTSVTPDSPSFQKALRIARAAN